MRFPKIVQLLTVAAPLALVACSGDDITNEGAGEPFAIVTSRSSVQQAVGNRVTITAQVIDRGGTPLDIPVTATALVATAATVDSTVYVKEIQETRFFIRSLAVNAGAAIELKAGPLTDTVNVRILSGPFPGTVNTAAFSGGQVLQFTSTTPLFDANTAVTVTTSEPGYLIDVTPTRVRYLLPFGTGAGAVPYSITGAGPADFSLTGSATVPAVACADSFEPNNTRATANTSGLVVGTSLYGSGQLTSDSDDYYRVTITEPGTYRFEIDWTDATDVDLIPRSPTGAVMSGAAATAAKPERANVNITAPGDYFVQVNMYDDAGGACTTYKLTVTKQ